MISLSPWGLAPVLAATLGLLSLAPSPAAAQEFTFENLTDHPDGPGSGSYPSINDRGDVAFMSNDLAYVYDRQADTFLNLHTLPGAPAQGWYPKINTQGNVAFVDPGTDDLWLYEAVPGSLTNLSLRPGYPGNSGAHSLNAAFDLNDANQISFHSGDLNFGDVYVYTHATGEFVKVTDQPGGPSRGRDNAINDQGQVAYSGFPDIYVFDIAGETTLNITDLPGGPGTGLGAFSFNDVGDVALFASGIYYTASTGVFLDLSALPGFPAGTASSNANDISNRGEATFWRDGTYYYDPVRRTFTRLNGQGAVPSGGLASSINERGVIAFDAGTYPSGDVFVATPKGPQPPRGLRVSP